MFDRRQFLQTLGGATIATPLSRCLGESPSVRKRLLVFTRSQNFQHDVVKLESGTCLVHETWKHLAGKLGWDVDCTKDGRVFERDTIAKYDLFFFFTTGDLVLEKCDDGTPPMSKDGKAALIQAVATGKGFIGSHCAADTFHSPGDQNQSQLPEQLDPYIRLLGGEFIRHGPQQIAKQHVVSDRFPGLPKVKTFDLKEEWYSFKNYSDDIEVLLTQETAGMDGSEYQRPNYPATWVRRHGKGKVYYTSLGHREDVWTNPLFHEMLIGAAMWTSGRVDHKIQPNLKVATPEAAVMPPRPLPEKKK